MSLLNCLEPFVPSQISRVRHRLAEHPLMSVDSLAKLALRHDPRHVRFHDGLREFKTVFGDVLNTDPGRSDLRRAIANLGKSKVFIQINGVRDDALYASFIDAFFDEATALMPRGDRPLLYRDAAAFLASPGSVTPYHIDHEQNFLLHIQGPKQLHVWDGRDRNIVSNQVLETFYGDGTQRQLGYREEFKERARVFELSSGDGVYMPMGSPHAVQTGAGVTVTFSMLFNTRTSLGEIETYKANFLLRRLGFSPAAVGTSPTKELVKRNAYRAARFARSVAGGRRPQPTRYL